MKTPSDGWLPDEREALSGLEGELEALQQRHDADPPLDVLRAARAGVLPEPMQARVAARLERSRWDRALVDGAADPGAALDAETEVRILERLKRHQAEPARRRIIWSSTWQAALAAAAVLLLAVAGWMWRSDPQSESSTTPRAQAPSGDRRLPRPSFVLALEAPEIKLSASALVFRGPATTGLLSDAKPAFDAFRAGRFAQAQTEFARLAPLYPTSIEVAFYGGVTRLYLDDLAGAEEELARAERIGDEAFAQDVSWYRAIADERAGRTAQARVRVTAICQNGGPRAEAACTAAEKLKEP